MKYIIPPSVLHTGKTLLEAGFEVYLVGGCVRDLLMQKKPKDWDFTTNALPEQIQKLFPDSFYENTFGTVGIKVPEEISIDSSDRIIEITTYRTELGYSDNRRPDHIHFAKTLKEDLLRRDFTMNAIALSPLKNEIQDFYNGEKDIEQKIIRAVGDPNERFSEDALRMMRAVRFSSELCFSIEEKTLQAIQKNASLLKNIAKERIRLELERILLSPHPSEGIEMLEKSDLLQYIIPELREGIGVSQNLHHTYTVWEHNLLALKTCPSKKLSVRLAALLHDVGKPRTKKGDGKFATFYNHDHVGARITREILKRLTFPREIVEHTTLLVDQHLFYYNVEEVTESAVRRVIARVGLENIKDLIDVRIGDRLGSGVPKAKPYRLRHFEYMVEKVSHDPINVKDLKINGNDLTQTLTLKPGPKIGAILDVLLGEVIEDSSKNTKEFLLERARKLESQEIETLRHTAKSRIEEQRKKDEDFMKSKYWVK
ncbi:MAG: HDIG domain-containing protein [Candidatus Moraniibacteriota bacterium]|nr:MAG: HDIG domain-containing protein [Candidatus Moranbacteria bacterium]